MKLHLKDFWNMLRAPFSFLKTNPFSKSVYGSFVFVRNLVKELIPVSPQKRLMAQSAIFSLGVLFLSSFSVGAGVVAIDMSYSTDYISAYELPGDILISDESGYLVKINPQTDAANRVGLTDFVVHTVESGEVISVIAEKYGLNVETIMWANNMSNPNAIRVGTKLYIPPVDGIEYKVTAGDSLEKIATKYKIEVSDIVAQNALESEVIVRGQKLFLPDAAPLQQTIIASRATTASRSTRSYANVSNSSSTPAGGKLFIYPTIGNITQGYRAGHYAIDIADSSRPAVWAAGGGTIEKASSGTWGGGYGNHIIIDHGDGLKTLYAHLDSLNVSEGDYVNQGDVIGIMGNTGRVYGRTGIHLHWEVIDNGVKQYPGNYY